MIMAVNESKALKRVVFDNLAKTPERRGHGCIGDCNRRDEDLDDYQGHFSLSAPSWRGGYSLDLLEFARQQHPVLDTWAERTAGDARVAQFHQYYREAGSDLDRYISI